MCVPVLVGEAAAATGDVTQKAGVAGCVSDTGAGPCVDGTALDGATSVTVSPDGKSVYAAARDGDAVVVFDRAADGALTQKAGTAGCISDSGSGGACADGTALDSVYSVTISPDGRSVYATSELNAAVAVFDRDANGALTQKAGAAGCISDSGSGGACADGTALLAQLFVTVSPDGANVYAASFDSDAVAVFDRAPDGSLTQKAGTAGCISNSGSGGACAHGQALNAPRSITVSADGASAYVASTNDDAVAVFDRDSATGALTQKAGAAGCISETGHAGLCADGTGLDGARSVTISPDGNDVYATGQLSDAVALFDRAADGALTQGAGTAGCVSETGSAGLCIDGRALDGAFWVTVSPDGRSVYVASTMSDAVAVFDRDGTGGLTQKAGAPGCVSETGADGCADGTGLDTAIGVTVSPDNRSVYAASLESDAVAVFDRVRAGADALPALSRVSLSRRSFKARVGTSIRFTLSKDAKVRITVARHTIGRRVGRNCVALTPATRRHAPCVRYVARGTLSKNAKAGANTVRFTGRVAGRLLTPGSYRFTVRATASGNRRSNAINVTFRVVR